MANITVPNKNTGDQHTAAEVNQQTGWTNSPMKSLGAFSPAMTFDSQGYYDKYTLTSDIVVSATGIVDGQFRSVWIETDGIHTITAGVGMSVSITDFTNIIEAGTYLFMFGSFPDDTGVSKVVTSVPNIKFAEGTLTTPTLTATAGDAQITLIISNEDVRQTGRILLRNTVNDFGTATPVAGYDNTTNYVDSGLVNDTEYFYFFYNTATGLNNSVVATDSATPIAAPSYIFSNTQKLNVNAVGDYVNIINNNMYPSGAYSFEIWGNTPASLGFTGACMKLIDDSDNFILSDIQINTGDSWNVTFRTDGSNRMVKGLSEASSDLLPSTKYQIIITKGSADDYASVTMYKNGSAETQYSDSTVGTYAGIRPLVGNVVLNVPRSSLASFLQTVEGFRVFNDELTQLEVTELYDAGSMVALSTALQAKCVQENLLNGNANADNIGVNGTTEGGATYTAI